MRSLKPSDTVSIARMQKQLLAYRQSNMSNTVGPPTRKTTYPLSNGISNVHIWARCSTYEALRLKLWLSTHQCSLTMSEQDVEHHHDPFYSWSGVKRWRGEGEAYSSASTLSSVIYEVVWQRRQTIRLVGVSRVTSHLTMERPDGAVRDWITILFLFF